MTTSPIHGLYAIIDPQYVPGPIEHYARALLSGGCRLLQLRVKDDVALRAAAARAILALKKEYEFCFIMNDDAALAREFRADGVHLGPTDTPVVQARALLGPHTLIGFSAATTGLPGALAAQEAGADYVAFGAVYPTNTKGPDHPVQGIPRLQEMVNALSVPVVAIGGITRENVLDVWRTGVAAVAMITALARAPDPTVEANWYVQRLRKS
ncbi:MAG: thiamine phosphate synthase [Deltaproteobacteria bacterium]|nr:thiamine phosphate synthase [Deltaproteobacteria bacterium]